MAEKNKKLLEVRRIRAGYGVQDVLFGVSVSVDEGEVVSIFGPNGAGKSTLLKTIAGVVRIKSGEILFKGIRIDKLSPQSIVKNGLGWVPQENNIFPRMTVRENLEMGGFTLKDDLEERMEEVFSIFPQLREKLNQPAGSLSGGQRQMLAVGRGLMVRPELLLLDEPTAGLAPNLVHMMLEKVGEITRQFRSSVLLVTQTLDALRFSRRGYLLASGEIKYEDTTDSLLNNEEVKKLYFGGITVS